MTWEEHKPLHWILSDENKPITGLRFEDSATHKSRSEWDRKNYTLGSWNAHVKASGGARHLTWPGDTPILTMQREIEGLVASRGESLTAQNTIQ